MVCKVKFNAGVVENKWDRANEKGSWYMWVARTAPKEWDTRVKHDILREVMIFNY
jgi:hypothetical protein